MRRVLSDLCKMSAAAKSEAAVPPLIVKTTVFAFRLCRLCIVCEAPNPVIEDLKIS